MKPPATRCARFKGLPWVAKSNAIGLGVAVAALARLLWPLWLHDDNLTHGIFLPFLTGILLMESRRDPSPRFLRPGTGALALCGLLILAGLASFSTAIIYASALGWTHAMAEFMLCAGLAFALGAAWLGFADQRLRFIPMNWAAFVGAGLWFFAGPLPPGTYARLALFLQTHVTDGVVGILNALSIAAYQDGNVINLARTSVGVSEACSGVRSLISCTVAGLFLSAVLVRRPSHRALVVVLSPSVGLAMNFLRSLLLTLLANAGVEIEGRWHDLTGASILVATTLIVAAFALWLHRREPAAVTEDNPPLAPPAGRSPLQAMLAGGLLVVAGMAAVLAVAGQRSDRASRRAPDLASLLPEPPPGWTAQTTPGLDQYSGVLHTHALTERVYSAGSTPRSVHLTLYLAYWQPGQAPVSLVDAHTPDTCWPGTGWEPEAMPNDRATLGIEGRMLSPAEFRIFARNGFETRVWFWHLYGGRPITFVDPYSAPRLLGLALRYGFGHPEDQLFVRISSNRPWEEVASLPALRQFLQNLKPLGL